MSAGDRQQSWFNEAYCEAFIAVTRYVGFRAAPQKEMTSLVSVPGQSKATLPGTGMLRRIVS